MFLQQAQSFITNEFWKKVVQGTKKFNWKGLKKESMKRQFSFLSAEGTSVLAEKDRVEVYHVIVYLYIYIYIYIYIYVFDTVRSMYIKYSVLCYNFI